MRQLSGIDSMFLFQETAAQPMHVATLRIFDPAFYAQCLQESFDELKAACAEN